ncbi:hypothetical protein [Paractinoplanes atraurantiacus]|nr:hypothetical protein [Actinoplanes atraurantiacus]
MRSKSGEEDPPWLTTSQKQRHGFSEDSWTRATKELESDNLLITKRTPQGREIDFRRLNEERRPGSRSRGADGVSCG